MLPPAMLDRKSSFAPVVKAAENKLMVVLGDLEVIHTYRVKRIKLNEAGHIVKRRPLDIIHKGALRSLTTSCGMGIEEQLTPIDHSGDDSHSLAVRSPRNSLGVMLWAH